MSVPVLVDLANIPSCHCDSAIEDLFKALAQDPHGQPESIWAPVENVAIRQLVEDVSAQMQVAVSFIEGAIARLLGGEPMGEMRKAHGAWSRWDQVELDRARTILEGKPAAAFTLDDWLLVIDYLLQRYLPDGVILTIADYLTVRAALAGKIQARLNQPPPTSKNAPDDAMLQAMVEHLPIGLSSVPARVLTPIEAATVKIAQTRAAENISSVVATSRHRMKTLIIQHVQAQVLGQPAGQYTALRQSLFDEFADLNRDFRRIAVTEAGECCNQGFIAAQAPGRRVKRREAYRGACDFCKSIDGKVFEVVASDAPEKDGQTQVWQGKTNIGRSAAPRKRTEAGLVARSETEMWWPAAGVQHPHCRGSWVAIADKPPAVSDAFASWMDGLIDKKLPARPGS